MFGKKRFMEVEDYERILKRIADIDDRCRSIEGENQRLLTQLRSLRGKLNTALKNGQIEQFGEEMSGTGIDADGIPAPIAEQKVLNTLVGFDK